MTTVDDLDPAVLGVMLIRLAAVASRHGHSTLRLDAMGEELLSPAMKRHLAGFVGVDVPTSRVETA